MYSFYYTANIKYQQCSVALSGLMLDSHAVTCNISVSDTEYILNKYGHLKIKSSLSKDFELLTEDI
jgi:hypothetical protein